MAHEQLYASFLLDRESMLEIAMPAGKVIEAIPVTSTIKPVPSSADFMEGIMRLRDDVIPIINMKKRLGIPVTSYSEDAKVAVVKGKTRDYGLLFDDIQDVLRVSNDAVEQLDPELFTKDSVITKLIKLDSGSRTLQLLDLDKMFPGGNGRGLQDSIEQERTQDIKTRHYSRYVIFRCSDQEYGVPVEDSQEICFLAEIDKTFQHETVEGVLQLRGHTIPVLNGHHLLGLRMPDEPSEMSRVLVMRKSDLSFGIIVDEIREIIMVEKDKILPMPVKSHSPIEGICQYSAHRNIMLINTDNLLSVQLEKVKSMCRFRSENLQEEARFTARHLITEHCYLVFSIGKNFAIELKDVQEILETSDLLALPDDGAILHDVINLRGKIVPVLDLRNFYGYAEDKNDASREKLIIGQSDGRNIGLIVDEIITIYKQEAFYPTPALKAELQDKKDTLDRLIEYVGESGLKEHVLVVNIKNILEHHILVDTTDENQPFEHDCQTAEAAIGV